MLDTRTQPLRKNSQNISRYTYSIETNAWLADGKPLQTQQSQTYKDENGTVYFWNDMKKLWVTEAGICYNAETGEYSVQGAQKLRVSPSL